MDTWTALALSHQKACELQRDAARHRLAKLAAMSARSRRSSARAAEGRRAVQASLAAAAPYNHH